VDRSLCENAFQVSRYKVDHVSWLSDKCLFQARAEEKCTDFYAGQVLYSPSGTHGKVILKAKDKHECRTACFEHGYEGCRYGLFEDGKCTLFGTTAVRFLTTKQKAGIVGLYSRETRTADKTNLPYDAASPVYGNEVAVSSEFRVHLRQPSGALVNPGTMLSDDVTADPELRIGHFFRYCIIAAHTSDAGDTSEPTCLHYPVWIHFDFKVRVFTGLSRALGSIPVEGVEVTWRLGEQDSSIGGVVLTDADGKWLFWGLCRARVVLVFLQFGDACSFNLFVS
jgi:hypothetical protein